MCARASRFCLDSRISVLNFLFLLVANSIFLLYIMEFRDYLFCDDSHCSTILIFSSNLGSNFVLKLTLNFCRLSTCDHRSQCTHTDKLISFDSYALHNQKSESYVTHGQSIKLPNHKFRENLIENSHVLVGILYNVHIQQPSTHFVFSLFLH